MNIEKISRLSGIHKTLSRFHEQCYHNDVELVAIKHTSPAFDITLGSSVTQSVIDEVRKAVGEELEVLEEEIKEAANG